MNGDFIKELVEHIAPRTFDVDGFAYASTALKPVQYPMPEAVQTTTLASVVDYVKLHPDDVDPANQGRLIVHVVSSTRVSVLGPIVLKTEQRPCYLTASCTPALPAGFLGNYHQPDSFIIALQALFDVTDDLALIEKIVGTVEAEAATGVDDDGISQKVIVRQGITRKAETLIRNPVRLAAHRTFAEIAQPISAYVFRLRGGGGDKLPECALFPADGGAWTLAAMAGIKAWLEAELPEVPIIA